MVNFIIIWPAPRAGKLNQLAAGAGKMVPSFALGMTRCVPQEQIVPYPIEVILY